MATYDCQMHNSTNQLTGGPGGPFGPCGPYIESQRETELRLIISSPVYSLLHYHTIVHHFTVTVNNIEVTVNTCTCTDMFTVITTKDQSGGIYNSYSTGGQGFMGVSKQTLSSGYALGLALFTAINPWHQAITITYGMPFHMF